MVVEAFRSFEVVRVITVDVVSVVVEVSGRMHHHHHCHLHRLHHSTTLQQRASATVSLLCQKYNVSQKNPPLWFSEIFSPTVGNF